MPMLVSVLVNGLALWAAAALLDGITVEGGTTLDKALVLLGVAVVFGLVNAVVRPLLKFLSLPLLILTLGLFTFVINAAMLELTSWISTQVGLGFHVDTFFWDAILGAVIISVVATVLGVLLPDSEA